MNFNPIALLKLIISSLLKAIGIDLYFFSSKKWIGQNIDTQLRYFSYFLLLLRTVLNLNNFGLFSIISILFAYFLINTIPNLYLIYATPLLFFNIFLKLKSK